jgi:hypothetical protein
MLTSLLGLPPNAVVQRHPVPAPWKPVLQGDLGSPPSDHNFIMLHAAFRPSGGLLRGEDVAATMDERQRGDFVSLARLIVSRQIFSLQWNDTFWVPMLQFNPADLSLCHGPQQVMAELGSVFDGWTLATWYATPNSWLQGRKPLNLLDTHLDAVVQAARADRFVANG